MDKIFSLDRNGILVNYEYETTVSLNSPYLSVSSYDIILKIEVIGCCNS